ncbi:hypothetical protein ACIPWF_09075 [Paenarthrobacter sp. NPDC089989]|uniref:hypothetical protein n=1 Tax=unclassified Paenarthrobacter TaxID=2634190 RepID=UPI003829FB2D
MTYKDLEREAVVDELLLDADLDGDSDLRTTLLSIGSYASLPAPAPNAELAAMLAGPHDELSKRRWKRKHRAAVVSVAVAAAMGVGVSGVAAASSGFTRHPAFIDELFGNLAPHATAGPTALPIPDAPKVATEEGRQVDPVAVPAPTTTGAPVPTTAPAPEVSAQGTSAANPAAQAPAVQPTTPNAEATQDAAARPAETETKPGNPAAKPGPVKPSKPAKPEKSAQDKKQGNGNGKNQGNAGDQGQDGDKLAGRLPSLVDKLKEWLTPSTR